MHVEEGSILYILLLKGLSQVVVQNSKNVWID